MMIEEDYSERIDAFSERRLKILNSIGEIEGEENILFKKILYITFLDSISAIVYPDNPNNERFSKLIDRFSRWECRDRVSLPHLGRMLSLSPDPCLSKLRKYVKGRLEDWTPPCNNNIFSSIEKLVSSEPKWADIKGLCSGKDHKIFDSKISDCKHSKLLYQLRNSLVHQFQSRGDEFGSNPPVVPHYILLSESTLTDESLTSKPVRFELIYPAKFLETITIEAFSNVMEYMKENNINPYPHFYAGDYWIKGLN